MTDEREHSRREAARRALAVLDSLGVGAQRVGRGGELRPLSADVDPERRAAGRLALAKAVLAELGAHVPRVVPDRPADLPEHDHLLHATIRVPPAKRTDGDRRVARSFAAWKAEVARAESQEAGSIVLLMSVHDWLGEVADLAGDGSMDDEIAHLEEHLRRHWGLEPPWPDRRRDRDRLAAHAARQSDLLPAWLMNGDGPPRSQWSPAAESRPEDFQDD